MTKNIEEELTPTHLIPETDEIKKDIENSLPEKKEAAKKEKEKEQDPKLNLQYPFDFKWADRRGKVWEGKFINKILNNGDKMEVGLFRAKLAQGMPLDSLDDITSELNMMISHMAYSLVEVPDWAKSLQALTSFQLVQEIYMEVAQHEATFLGFGKLEV